MVSLGVRRHLTKQDEGKRRTILYAALLATLLAGTRLFAIIQGSPDWFWWLWGAMVVGLSFAFPLVGISLTLGNIMVSISDNSPWGLSVGHLAGAGAFARLLWDLGLQKRQLQNPFRQSHLAFLAILLVVLVGGIRAHSVDGALATAIKLLMIFALYLLVTVYLEKPRHLLFLQIVIVLSAAFSASWAIKDLPDVVGQSSRAEGLLGTANYMAIYSAVVIPLAVGLILWAQKSRDSILFLLMLIPLPLGIIAGASRGAAWVAIVSLSLSAILWQKRVKLVWLLLAFALILFLGFSVNEYPFERFTNTIAAIQTGTIETNSRVRLAEYSVEIWQRYPWLGVGARNWLYGLNEELGVYGYGSAHVVPAIILAETGILGSIAYLAFISLCLRDYMKIIAHLKQAGSPFLPLVQAWLIAAIAMSSAWTSGNPYNQFWFFLLMFGAITHRMFTPARVGQHDTV